MKTKWKYSREELAEKIENLMAVVAKQDAPTAWSHLNQIKINVLLAKQSKPKKELLHGAEKERGECICPCHKGDTDKCFCYCGSDPTSPVGRISEDKTVEGKIGLPKNIKYLNSDLKRWTKEITEAVNHLSSNAKTK